MVRKLIASGTDPGDVRKADVVAREGNASAEALDASGLPTQGSFESTPCRVSCRETS